MPRKIRAFTYSKDSAFAKRCERCGNYFCRCPKPKSRPSPDCATDQRGRSGQ